MDKIKGTGVALVTPFNSNNSIDYIGLEKLINHVIDGGVDYLVVLGTTGESATLSSSEKVDIIELIRCKPFPNELRKKIENYKNVLTVDEQTPSGGLKSIILENVKNNVCGLSLPDKFIYENLGREKLLDKNNLSIANILKNINRLIKNR